MSDEMGAAANQTAPQDTAQATPAQYGGQATPEPAQAQPAFDWRSHIPVDLKGEASLNAIKDVPSLIKGYVHAQRLVGGEKIALPIGANNTPEYWDTVADKLGRPKDATGYKFADPELPAGMPADALIGKDGDAAKLFGQFAHKNRLLPDQAVAMQKFFNDIITTAWREDRAQADKKYETTSGELSRLWGNRYDDYLKLANGVFKQFAATPEERASLSEDYGNDPRLLKLLANIGLNMREDRLIRGDKPSFELDGTEAEAKKNDILNNKQNPLNEAYFKKAHPRHNYAVEQVTKLNEIIASKGR